MAQKGSKWLQMAPIGSKQLLIALMNSKLVQFFFKAHRSLIMLVNCFFCFLVLNHQAFYCLFTQLYFSKIIFLVSDNFYLFQTLPISTSNAPALFAFILWRIMSTTNKPKVEQEAKNKYHSQVYQVNCRPEQREISREISREGRGGNFYCDCIYFQGVFTGIFT